MLLPDLDTLPRWAGHSSLGALLLDKESHDREEHAAEHKILKDLRSGNRVSIPRIAKLYAAIMRKWRPNDDVGQADIHECVLKSLMGEAPFIQIDFEREGALLFWSFLAKNLPEKCISTRSLLEGLIQNSMHLHNAYQDRGLQAVALSLSDFSQHPSAGIAQSRFLAEMIELIKEGKEEVARVELAAFGALLLSALFQHENESSIEATRNSLAKLFAAHQGRVDPLRSFSHWLGRLEARTGYAKDKLLVDGFVYPGGNTETLSEQDPRNLLRNPRRYRKGGQVPSFDKTQACLRSLCPALKENEREKWKAELEQRGFGAIFILLTANSARSIKKVSGVPERPSQAVYDLFTSGAG
jgi:hypothetical protein